MGVSSKSGEKYVEEDEESLIGEHEDINEDQGKISSFKGFWNVCNSIQGVAILAMPYTISKGGWWSILAMILVATLSNYTGQILINCQYVRSTDGISIRKRRVYNGLAEMASAVWPSFGRGLALIIQGSELLFMATLYPIIAGSVLHSLEPVLHTSYWILIFGLVMMVNVSFRKLSHISWISFITVIAAVLISTVLFVFCVTQIQQWKVSVLDNFDVQHFPVALGIIVASYSSQMYLTVIEENMKDKEKMGAVMNYAYVAMTTAKIAIGVTGYLTFQGKIQEVITLNLPAGYMLITINVIVIILAISSYSLPMFTVFDIVEKEMLAWKKVNVSSDIVYEALVYLVRTVLIFSTLLMAVLVPHFSLVLSFVGSMTGTLLEFVFPCWFHLKLKYRDLKWYEMALDAFILLGSAVFTIVGLYYSAYALVVAFQTNEHDIWTVD